MFTLLSSVGDKGAVLRVFQQHFSHIRKIGRFQYKVVCNRIPFTVRMINECLLCFQVQVTKALFYVSFNSILVI